MGFNVICFDHKRYKCKKKKKKKKKKFLLLKKCIKTKIFRREKSLKKRKMHTISKEEIILQCN